MSYPKVLTSVALLALLAAFAPGTASAQGRSRGHAVAHGPVHVAGSVHAAGPVVVRGGVGPYYHPYYRPYYYPYRPVVNVGFFYGAPGFYGAYAYGSPYWGFGYAYGYPAYGYPGYGYAPYAYGYGGYSGRPYGGVRIDVPQRDGEVYVDGNFTGAVDDFDGTFQQANLEAGPHHIEVRADGFEPIAFDIRVEPGQTITYRGAMRPLQ